MRIHGTLTKWNDERGFGFISQGSREIFVHISAFPRDGVRPTPEIDPDRVAVTEAAVLATR